MGKRGRFICGGVATAIGILGALLIAAGLVVVLKVMPDQIKDGIKKDKQLIKYKNGTYNDYTKDWVSPKYIQRMQYWVYDYKNPISIINRGQLPDVDEKGPYTYVEDTFNDITWMSDDNTILNYTQTIRYRFDPEQSCLGCDPYKDTVLVPDISFILALEQFGECYSFFGSFNLSHLCDLPAVQGFYDNDLVPLLADAMDLFDTGPFVRVTIDQLLISGYEPKVYVSFLQNVLNIVIDVFNILLHDIINPLQHAHIEPPQNVSYGQTLFYTSPHYIVTTGKDNYKEVGFIKSFTMEDPFNKNITLSTTGTTLPEQWWSKCNGDTLNSMKARTVAGNTGDFYPSFLEKKDVVPIYVDSICRSILMKYQKEVTYEGIDAYRFVLPADEFNWDQPENCGFCFPLKHDYFDRNQGDHSYPNGIMDLRGCQEGNPVAISKPHFYEASDVVKNFIPRFKSSDDDNVWMDVEPQSGTILMAHKRMQINLMANQFKNISSMKVFMPGAYPIYWLNESFYADQGTVRDLKNDLINPQKLFKIICYSAVGLGGLLILISILSCFGIVFVSRRQSSKID
ncbi:unnamed protein product, partial [Mesorhabditis belari]|uniref:CD36 family protein n=1 Tax=Mesorhabditis belari TaxID=2138241 RepID=A0AAF3JB18_9BILA